MWLIISSLLPHNVHLLCLVCFCFKIVLMALFFAAIRRDSVSLLRFPFLNHVQVFSCENLLVCRLKCPYSCFSSNFCFLVIFILLMFVFTVLLLVVVISLPSCFFLCLLVVISMHLRYLNAGEFSSSFFSWHSRSTSSLGCKASWVFLFYGPFVEFLLSTILRMVPSILRRGQPRCLSLWRDFCYVVWFRVIFSFSWGILFKFILSPPYVWKYLLPVFGNICKFSFLLAFWCFLDLIVLFLPLITVFCFSLLALHIFLCQIPSLCRHCISSLPVLGFPVLFHFWQTVWCRPCTLGSWVFLAICTSP